MNSGQLRLMVVSAALALGIAGGAQARTHGHAQHERSGFSAHASLGRGTPIAFSGRHGGSRMAYTEIGSFRGHGRHGGRAGRFAGSHYGHSGGGIQCVTFARADSGIELSGNASSWWYNAEGLYQRGQRPEAGSVLNFRANGAMRMGHVAVVNQVIDSRTIEIDHANWGGPGAVRGGVSRDISVVDVSPNNDWTAVRVGLGHSGEFGSIYPTYGFIYNRPDRGTLIAAANAEASPLPAMNPAPRDLRGRVRTVQYDEVAEAPDEDVPSIARHFHVRPHHHASTGHHRLHGRY